MTLDMPTISLVSISATTLLGLVLLFVWWRERSSALIGWWGVAQLVMASGIAMAATASATNHASLSVFGQAMMVLSAAILWMAVREFEGRRLDPVWVAVWPCGVIIAAATGLTATFDQRLILGCTLMATLNLMAAAEFTYQEAESWCRAGRRSCCWSSPPAGSWHGCRSPSSCRSAKWVLYTPAAGSRPSSSSRF